MTLKKLNKTTACTGLIALLLFLTCEKPERAVQFTTFAALEVDITYTSVTLKGEVTGLGSKTIEDHEWTTLTTYLSTNSGGHMKESGLAHWLAPNTGADNTSKFTALPGGFRNSSGNFQNLGTTAYFSTNTLNPTLWYYLVLYYNSTGAPLSTASKNSGYSVRCIKD